MSYLFEQPLRVSFQKAGQQFGFWATPLAESIQQTIAWHRTHVERPPFHLFGGNCLRDGG